jgi:dTDP-4-dehydrorhamnose 3,5-epimerase
VTARFDVRATPLEGVLTLQRLVIADDRGWFERLYGSDDLAGVVGARRVVQVNRTLTRRKGSVRGLHYQVAPYAEAKFVSCLRGAVYDVAVDVRRGSPTFLRWHAERLAAEDHRSLFIAEGIAHGFQALTEDCELLYFHTAAYHPAAERGVHPLDPRLAIPWPLDVARLSQRDAALPMIEPDFEGIAP